MAVGANGNVVVTGTFSITYGVDHPVSVVRIDGTNGVPLWQHDVPAPERSAGVTIGFDPAGTVLASGDFITSDNFVDPVRIRDIVAVKLNGATGEEIWRTISNGADVPFDVD